MNKIIAVKDFAKENENKQIEILDDGMLRVLEPVKIWVPKAGEKYWFISGGGHVLHEYWTDTDVDFYRLYNGNVFRTKEIAQKVCNITFKFKKLAYEEMVDWEDEKQSKHYLWYDHKRKRLDVKPCTYMQEQGKDHFKYYDKLRTLIIEVGEADVIKYYLKIGVNE